MSQLLSLLCSFSAVMHDHDTWVLRLEGESSIFCLFIELRDTWVDVTFITKLSFLVHFVFQAMCIACEFLLSIFNIFYTIIYWIKFGYEIGWIFFCYSTKSYQNSRFGTLGSKCSVYPIFMCTWYSR